MCEKVSISNGHCFGELSIQILRYSQIVFWQTVQAYKYYTIRQKACIPLYLRWKLPALASEYWISERYNKTYLLCNADIEKTLF